MSDTRELIARLERATGPDRQIDNAIAEDVEMPLIDMNGWPPRYTESIDAALTLVGYHREWLVGSVGLLGTFWAEIITPIERYVVAKEAKTPAIALCLAALRSRTGERA